MPELPRKPSSSKGKSKKSSKRRTSNFEADKLTNFGWILAVCGALSFVLPAFGVQIKGLHRLSPEAQTIGGLLFLLVGGLILAVVYGRQFLGPWLSDLPKGLKWSVILGGGVLAVAVVGLSVMFIGPSNQSGMIPDRKVDPTEAGAPNVAQHGQPSPGGLAGQGDPPHSSELRRFPRPSEESMRPERRQPQPGDTIGPGGVIIPSGGLVNPPGIAGNPLRNSGNPAQIPGAPPGFMDNPGAPPGFPRPNRGNMSLEEQFADFGPDRTVTIVFTGPPGAVNFTQMLSRFQQNGSGVQIGSGGGSGQTYTIRVAPVKDIQEFADKIGVGTVTQVDPTKRVINVKLQ